MDSYFFNCPAPCVDEACRCECRVCLKAQLKRAEENPGCCESSIRVDNNGFIVIGCNGTETKLSIEMSLLIAVAVVSRMGRLSG